MSEPIVQDSNYRRVHQWLIFHFGNATHCEDPKCPSVNPKRFEWALIKGKEYEKKRENFTMRCPSCHRKYDYTDGQKKKQSAAKIGKVTVNSIPVTQYTFDGVKVAEYRSGKQAAEAIGGEASAFSALRRGRLKTYKGFIWKHANCV